MPSLVGSEMCIRDRQCPSWLYEVRVGATTVWERWDGLDENGECPIGDDGTDMMISYNHYASGAVGAFLYRRVLGVCLLYTSDAADDLLCGDLGGRRNI